MSKKTGTVCFIVNNDKILLALIEYSSSDRKWNGIGGYVEDGETPEDAVIREIKEETFIAVDKNNLKRIKVLDIGFNLIVFKTSKWGGELKTKDPTLKELRWFRFDEIPYDQMHADNKEWFQEVLAN